MKIRKSHNANQSVLNTDAFDKRRFREIFEMSSGLQKVRGESELPLFESLLADIWASLYKMKPEITLHIDSDLMVNKSLMERIMAEECFVNFRSFTRLDDLSSAIGAVKFGEKTNQWLAEQKREDEDLQKQLEEILQMHRQLRRHEWEEETRSESRKTDEEFTEMMTKLDEKLQQILRNNSESFSQALVQAIQETKQVKEGLISLLGGIRSGCGDGDLKQVPLRDQISLAEKIASNKKMKEIAGWAGRFKQVARKKQKTKYNEAVNRSGVTIGTDIERLLPIELGLYMHPQTKTDFLRRFVEGQTMMYVQEGREVLGKGPIILCLDQSSSMRSLDTQAKGFTLALMSIARRQRRDFCLILFSTHIQVLKYEKGKIKSSDIVNLAQIFLSGGTNFAIPLSRSLSVINESRFKEADVVFVTDGEDEINDSFLEEFNKKKKEKAFNVLSFIVGSHVNTVESFSDKVVMMKDFEDESSYTAFEI
ncbi:VWA domain-containing protein [Sporosarcina sp. Marseille-Q4943]|uniref:vWA domain-containing protein n=1 Tax=Sporosarcina sp. Marseille-Q4943 TaxID=2942204 RepID=UPI00208DC887|nr:VWA domain-containing protein [Sporosarcina sp. Marseille-Q4943]